MEELKPDDRTQLSAYFCSTFRFLRRDEPFLIFCLPLLVKDAADSVCACAVVVTELRSVSRTVGHCAAL